MDWLSMLRNAVLETDAQPLLVQAAKGVRFIRRAHCQHVPEWTNALADGHVDTPYQWGKLRDHVIELMEEEHESIIH